MARPTFIIAGAMRSGTTALARYLGEHPDVFMAATKELHFFDRHFDRGVEWYEAQFEDGASARARGEATPAYLYDPVAAPRIADVLPGLHLVIMLRNPVDRAYSHYWHKVARGSESLTFADAIAAEPERLATGGYDAFANFSYLDRGRYAAQLERLTEHVPRAAMVVQLFEEFHADPKPAYAELCRFLGVDDGFVPSNLGEAINRFTRFRSRRVRELAAKLPKGVRNAVGRVNQVDEGYPPMAADVRARLLEQFAEDNAALAKWLGRDLSGWER